jgi:hypothetical protein
MELIAIQNFLPDFMFELTKQETENLRSQIVTSSWGGLRYLPFAFTEQGVPMLSGVLKSQKALQVNITIMRVFIMTRQYYSDATELKQRIESLENEMQIKFKDIYEALNFLLNPPGPESNRV